MAVVAIGQQLGSRTHELGSHLAERLGCRLLTADEIIEKAAQRYHLDAGQLKIVDERQPTFWERFRTDTERLFVSFRAVALSEMAAGNVVVIARSVALILPPGVTHVLRVKAVAPLAERIAQVAAEESLSASAAERRVRESDRELKARLQALLGVDADDPAAYQIVVNTAQVPLATLADLLAEAARRVYSCGREDSRQLLRDTAASTALRAAFCAHPQIGHAAIEINVSGGVAHLIGSCLTPPWGELVRQVASDVEWVKAVELVNQEIAPTVRPA